MRFAADFHVHSPYSRATSKASTLDGLAAWATVKGIDVVATGDCVHPGWLARLREGLVAAEPGLYRLRRPEVPDAFSTRSSRPVATRFVLATEISSIYKKGGRVRKIHNLLLLPDLEAAARLAAALARRGNIESDGRPILGLDARDLLEIFLDCAPEGVFIPAHIWTPWFSLFGSRSGFSSIDECFGDLAPAIFALETGLSSDPDMNRLVSALDRFSLVSNSDCHSPAKLGREANLFDTDLDFFAMAAALRHPEKGFLGTVEFFPEEGKYHLDGHRDCKVCLEPEETARRGGVCPLCGRPLTIGVLSRVLELADRDQAALPAGMPGFRSLIPLAEVLGELMGRGPATVGVQEEYRRLIGLFGTEFALLLEVPEEEIRERHSRLLAEAIARMRRGCVFRQPGFDGEFGVIRVFAPGEMAAFAGQDAIFSPKRTAGHPGKTVAERRVLVRQRQGMPDEGEGEQLAAAENSGQQAVLACTARHRLVLAGPGTGKTHTLVAALARLLETEEENSFRAVAITFTNRAADELAGRLRLAAGSRARTVQVATFHSFALGWLRRLDPLLTVAGEEDLAQALAVCAPAAKKKERQDLLAALALLPENGAEQGIVSGLRRQLAARHLVAVDGIVPALCMAMERDPDFAAGIDRELSHLFIDEFQDVNAAQYRLVTMLAHRAAVFAIGDPDQAIYGFRGASPAYFFRFQQDFDATVLPLTENYRSTPQILAAARAVIAIQPLAGWMRPALMARAAPGGPVGVLESAGAEAEALAIAHLIEELVGGTSHLSRSKGRGGKRAAGPELGFRDIAVLYRLNQQAAPLTQALERQGIPLQVAGVPAFFRRPKLLGPYLLVLAAAGLADAAEIALLGRKMRLPAEKCAGLLREFVARAAADGVDKALAAPGPFWPGDDEEAGRFLAMAGVHGGDVAAFGRWLRRNENGMEYDEKTQAVALMSIHAAKGLEFAAVIVAGAEEGLLPCSFAGGGMDLDEERRLFYVAMTRAKTRLVVSWSRRRVLFGKSLPGRPTPFLGEIPAALLQSLAPGGTKRKKTAVEQRRLF